MDSKLKEARRAGLWYGLAGAAAPFSYLYVPGSLLVQGNALATAERVRASENLLRASIFGELCGATLLLFAALALYRLFKDVHRGTALVMVAMMLVSIPISFVNALFHLAPILLVKNPAFVAVLDPGQVAALVLLFLRMHAYGLLVNQIFWGLWLFPIGLLVMRSGFLPRWLGIPLFFAGTGYVLNSLGSLLLPASLRWMTDSLQVLGIGEIPLFSFYLWIWGVRGHAVSRPAAALYLTSFVIGALGLLLLMSRRIDPGVYGLFAVASLLVLFGLVMRWRAEEAP